MLESIAAFTMSEHLGGLTFPGSAAPAGYTRILHGRQPVQTRDGWHCILPYGARQWRELLVACGRPELVEKYVLEAKSDVNANIEELNSHLVALGPNMTSAEWVSLCDSLDIANAGIARLDEVIRHPHLVDVELFRLGDHPTEGTIREIRPPVVFSETPASLRTPAPTLGQHTSEVLSHREADTERGTELDLWHASP